MSLWDHVSIHAFDTSSRECEHKHRECWRCSEPFTTNQLTILTQTREERYHISCYTNTDNFIIYKCPLSTEDLWNYQYLTDEQKQYIDQILFPQKIPFMKRFQINLPSIHIDEIDNQDLIKICQQMDINAYYPNGILAPQFSQTTAIAKIKKYLEHSEAKQKKECLVYRYCTEQSNETDLNFPVYLCKIVSMYFPIFY